MATTGLTVLKEVKAFGGAMRVLSHSSPSLGGLTAEFAIYLPAAALAGTPVPVVYYLSGLTCTPMNVTEKAGYQRVAAKLGIAVVCPDTSPRGAGIEGEDDGWDFGTGAGFYLNATQKPWSTHYNMYQYVTEELPGIVNSEFPVRADAQAITGHSMGGHGALICALKNPGKYKSVSAFSPICNPTKCPWGEKAFSNYLGPDKETWKEYDATELVTKYDGPALDVLIDQGSADGFLKDGQLLPEAFDAASKTNGQVTADVRMQEGYDHSYYFIASFMEEHLEFHARHLA